jgi:hypothetical protein
MRRSAALLGILIAGLTAEGAAAKNAAHEAAITRTTAAIEAGDVEPERDLKPLVDALRDGGGDLDDQKRLLGRIEWFGREGGDLTPDARRYLLDQATPVLLALGKSGGDAFIRGDALTALRDLGASRSVLEQAIAVAEADPDDYVKSRGEILRGALRSAPAP